MRVFLSRGYADTSMDRAAAAANVSKQTLYSHFRDKEGLFTALIERVTIERTQLELGSEILEGEPEDVLRRVAEVYLHKMDDDDYQSLFRIVIAESGRFPELAQLYTRTVIRRGVQMLTTYFIAHPELQLSDPEAAARIFWGTLVSFLVSQAILYGDAIMPMEHGRLIDSLVALLVMYPSRLLSAAQAVGVVAVTPATAYTPEP